jgi:formamidopyrimidine-DNA glycosylase
LIEKALPGGKLLDSETHGKQVAFRFSKGAWLDIHLGMSGKLRAQSENFAPLKHDHFVLYQKARTLVFSTCECSGRCASTLAKRC